MTIESSRKKKGNLLNVDNKKRREFWESEIYLVLHFWLGQTDRSDDQKQVSHKNQTEWEGEPLTNLSRDMQRY